MPNIWAIADVHLSFARPKPMEIFGDIWRDHPAKIERACQAVIAPDDLLLIPGDISWAVKRQDAERDLAWLARLPGTKVLIKGNHDYWWDSDKPLNFPGLHDTPFIAFDGAVGIAGTRGWDVETDSEKVSAREIKRLERRLAGIAGCARKIALIHYPPPEALAPLLQAQGVDTVLYGHLHLGGGSTPLPEKWHGMRALCVAADRLNFRPRLIAQASPEI
jgi:predicted phosphohydrolase